MNGATIISIYGIDILKKKELSLLGKDAMKKKRPLHCHDDDDDDEKRKRRKPQESSIVVTSYWSNMENGPFENVAHYETS